MSFAQPMQPARRAVPLAPLLDIMFLLLIFFVTTSNFRDVEQQLDVNLPAAQAAQSAQPASTEVVINVKADGTMTVANNVLTGDELYSLLRELVTQFPGERVIIRGDREVPYQHIVTAMDTANLAGVKDIRLSAVRRASEAGER